MVWYIYLSCFVHWLYTPVTRMYASLKWNEVFWHFSPRRCHAPNALKCALRSSFDSSIEICLSVRLLLHISLFTHVPTVIKHAHSHSDTVRTHRCLVKPHVLRKTFFKWNVKEYLSLFRKAVTIDEWLPVSEAGNPSIHPSISTHNWRSFSICRWSVRLSVPSNCSPRRWKKLGRIGFFIAMLMKE